MHSYSRISQIFRDIHCAFEKGVLFDSFILIHRSESFVSDNFIVSGITSSIFNDIKLREKFFFQMLTSVGNEDILILPTPRKYKIFISTLRVLQTRLSNFVNTQNLLQYQERVNHYVVTYFSTCYFLILSFKLAQHIFIA